MAFNIILPQKLHHFITERIRSGRFTSPAEVVRAGLKLLEQEEDCKGFRFSTREDLEQKLIEGIESGHPTRMTKKDWRTLRDRVHEYANANQS